MDAEPTHLFTLEEANALLPTLRRLLEALEAQRDRDNVLRLARPLRETRDMEATKRLFQRARTVVGYVPKQGTIDGHDAYPRAMCETLGPMEQDHRSIKQRYYPLRSFGSCQANVNVPFES